MKKWIFVFLGLTSVAGCSNFAEKSAEPPFALAQSEPLEAHQFLLSAVLEGASWADSIKKSVRKSEDLKRLMLEQCERTCAVTLKKVSGFNSQMRETKKSFSTNELADMPLAFQVRHLSRMKKNSLQQTADELLGEEQCKSSRTYLATSAILEKNLPEDQVMDQVYGLLKKSISCRNDDTLGRAVYRLVAFKVMQEKYQEAKSLLQNESAVMDASTTTRLKNLIETMEVRTPTAEEQEVAVKVSSMPVTLSFNPFDFLDIQKNKIFIEEALKNKRPIPVSRRVEGDAPFNLLAELIEALWLEGKSEEASWWLTRVDFERVKKPAERVYLSALGHLMGHHLAVFRLLTPMVRDHLYLVQVDVMKMLYPKPFAEVIESHSKNEGVAENLIYALVRQESAFHPKATSRVGARGLMQMMPFTARVFGVRSKPMLYDPDLNVRIGTKYVANLLSRFDGKVEYALASYNAGFNNVKEWQRRYLTDSPLVFTEVIPFKETRDYVYAIKRNLAWYELLYSEEAKASPPLLLTASPSPL